LRGLIGNDEPRDHDGVNERSKSSMAFTAWEILPSDCSSMWKALCLVLAQCQRLASGSQFATQNAFVNNNNNNNQSL
jgi:hypothetical protein